MTSRRISLAFILLSICAVGRSGEPVGLGKQIAPIFEQHCVRCRSLGNGKGDLSLATFDDLESNQYFLAGDPDGRSDDDSRLLWRFSPRVEVK